MAGLIENYVPDDRLWPRILKISQCLCEELESRGLLPGDCFCGVMPGEATPFDYQEGLAWVRLVTGNITTTFPTPDTSLRGQCATYIAAQLEVGVLHCGAPGIDPATGALPTQEEQLAVASIQIATMEAMRRAITCCGVEPMLLGTYTPIGPQGGLFGGQWTVQIGDE